MSKPVIFPGQVFGRLTILKENGRTKANARKYDCECNCGNIVNISGCSLTQKLTVSCGCFRKERVREALFKDISNQVFGRLIALEEISFGKQGSLWKCKCSCGNYAEALSGLLSAGHTKSCGCLGRDILIERNKQNNIDITGQRFSKLLVISLNAELKVRSWNCQCDCGKIITATTSSLSTGNTSSCGCLRSELLTPNLIGYRSGKLTVIEKCKTQSRKNLVKWLCQCECGNFKEVFTHNLTSNRRKSCGCLRRGKNSPNYDHSISNEEREIRKNIRYGLDLQYNTWRISIYKRDNSTCRISGIKIKNQICAHHIFNWKDNKEKRYDLDNGICLHPKIHVLFHCLYGKKNNTAEQLNHFKNRYLSKEFNNRLPENLQAK